MTEWKLQSPVVFIIFNRPDTTARVFAEIAKAKPSKLLVIADGPRPGRLGEDARCAATRAIIDRVDWDCDVLTNYSEVNLGCKNRVASGLDWAFAQVEEAIILEDDCLPDPSFFRFCDELLERYRFDDRVAVISGDNFQFGRSRTDADYYFSRYNHVWGWASWRRAWQCYDRSAAIWPAMRDGRWLKQITSSSSERRFWARAFQSVYDGKIDTWDYQWTLAIWSQGMLTILPRVNLIANIGFGVDATHTRVTNIFANLETGSLSFPLSHPDIVLPNLNADCFTARWMFNHSLMWAVIRKSMAHCPRLFDLLLRV